jgi:hypothetical protein
MSDHRRQIDETESLELQQFRDSGVLRAARVARPMVAWKPVKLADPSIVETLRKERDER